MPNSGVPPDTTGSFTEDAPPGSVTVDDGLVSEIAWQRQCTPGEAREWIEENGAREAFTLAVGAWTDCGGGGGESE